LDGASRIGLIQPQPGNDLQAPPSNLLSLLFRDDVKRLEVRRIVKDALDQYFVIDPTFMGNLRIRLSDKEPPSSSVERSLDSEAVRFFGETTDIAIASDGVKAFIGIIIHIIAGEPRIVMIDEPEAFLHPSLSSKLGKALGSGVGVRNEKVFVATHSSSFLMGCIQSGAPVNIVRLTYTNNVPTARLLPQGKVVELMRKPLLRSTKVLDALFYEFVIVTEADPDRAFYQEVNERLLAYSPEKGIPNCLFLNAQNKQTVWDIVQPLRELGIPAAGIVDIDVLKEGGNVWMHVLEGGHVPSANHTSLQQFRSEMLSKFKQTGKDMKRDGGISVLVNDDREACLNLFDQLSQYGIFVVPGGEVESWLSDFAIGGHGPSWLIPMFERLGENPKETAYVKPTDGDVWDFLAKVKQWLVNPNRKGIPE
jgi:hypothetical protein